MLKLVKIAGKMNTEYESRSHKIIWILLAEGTNDLGNVNFGYDEEPFPELRDLAVDTG